MIPGDDSTPLETSTPATPSVLTASLTFEGVKPPANNTGHPSNLLASDQSKVLPVPPPLLPGNLESSNKPIALLENFFT